MSQKIARRDISAAAATTIEKLEARRLLASIAGNIWYDFDGNRLRDFYEDPAAGVPVYLDLNQTGNRSAGDPVTFTDARGNFSFDDLAPGDYFVGIEFEFGGEQIRVGQTSPGITGQSNTTGDFNIDIVFADGGALSPELRTGVETAISRWEQVIIGDTAGNAARGIDDLQVTVFAQNLGDTGVLAFAGPRTTTNFPNGIPFGQIRNLTPEELGTATTGEVTLNTFYSRLDRQFFETVVHEVGHILGIGTLWDSMLINSRSPNVSYVGENGVREYRRIVNPNANSVPVEPFVEGHWDQNALFGREIMVPFSIGGVGEPFDGPPLQALSRITVGALEDLGFDVTYAGVEPFGRPGEPQIGVLPEDLVDGVDSSAFQIAVSLPEEGSVFNRANFGIRLNERPEPFFFNAGPIEIAPGQPLRLLAEGLTDLDFRDQVIQVNFYRDTGGEGLQTGPGGDELLAEVAQTSTPGVYELILDGDYTSTLAPGEYTFWARAFDRVYWTRDRATTVTVIEGQELPERPTSVRAIGIDENRILVNWLDNADDETGFLLQVSRSPNFDVPADIENIFLPASEGTGPVDYVYETEDGALSTRFFRVRAYNTAGATAFSGRPDARTLSRGEILVDDADAERVSFDGDFERLADAAIARNLTYLAGTTGTVRFDAGLDRRLDEGTAGNYHVFLRNPNFEGVGRVAVTVFQSEGAPLGTVEIDQNGARNSDVLLGTFTLTRDSFVEVTPLEGTARVDTVRFLPVA